MIEPDDVLSPEEASSRRRCLRAKLMEMRVELGCDLALQREGILRRSKRLVVLDMDSTLIQQEVIGGGSYDACVRLLACTPRPE